MADDDEYRIADDDEYRIADDDEYGIAEAVADLAEIQGKLAVAAEREKEPTKLAVARLIETITDALGASSKSRPWSRVHKAMSSAALSIRAKLSLGKSRYAELGYRAPVASDVRDMLMFRLREKPKPEPEQIVALLEVARSLVIGGARIFPEKAPEKWLVVVRKVIDTTDPNKPSKIATRIVMRCAVASGYRGLPADLFKRG